MSLKKYIPYHFKIRILLFLQKFKSVTIFSSQSLKKEDSKVFIFLAANYSNLGDVAITYAQEKFIQNTLPNHKVVLIPINKTIEGIIFVKSIWNASDCITIVGGGNFGDLYNQIEALRQLVIASFPNNKIISFPQTFDFSNSPKGKKSLEKAISVYSEHSNLSFFVREQQSFELMQRHFPKVEVFLTPDIVLSLDQSQPQMKRNGVTLSLRADDEKLLTSEQNESLINWAKQTFSNVSFYDTHINKGNLSEQQLDEELNNIWKQYKSSELVITDRLHGMIFAYITNTPCLVFLNNNHKISASYEWIKNQAPILLIKNFDLKNIGEAYETLNSSNTTAYKDLMEKYLPLKQQLLS
jgi:pyruvyl transferase EpsI